jgi:hypothetical protein
MRLYARKVIQNLWITKDSLNANDNVKSGIYAW